MLRKIALVFAILILLQKLAFAQFYTGPISSAMGGAGRAGNHPSESAFLNPATLYQLKNYYGGVALDWGDHPLEGATNEFAALLADGTPDKVFPGQFSYVQKRVTGTNGFSTNLQDFQLGIAEAPNEYLSFGISVHRETYQDNTSHAYAQNNVNFGMLVNPIQQLTFAFVAYDMLGGDDAVPQSYQTISTLALGSTYAVGDFFNFNVDLVRPDKFNDGHRLNTQVGVESIVKQYFAFRTGWQWREVGFEEKLFSFGLGYHGPRLSLDYTFQKDTLVGAGIRQYVDLWLHF